MKLTNEEYMLFKETHNKWLNENRFLAKLFAKRVAKSIKNDTAVQKAVADADDTLEKTKASIEKRLDNDKEAVKNAIPADVRKFLGFDY